MQDILHALGAEPKRVLEILAKDSPEAFRRAVNVAIEEAVCKKHEDDHLIKQAHGALKPVQVVRLCRHLRGLSIGHAREYVAQVTDNDSAPPVHNT